jgi:hypothetical protein
VIRIIFFVVVLIVLLHFVRRFLAGQAPAVSVAPQGIAVRGHRTVSSIGWQEIRQIDVTRTPTGVVEHFYVTLFGSNAISVYDHYRGFAEFEAAMFAHWPAIRAEWTRVQAGPPDQGERVTVWQQEG